jgi:hypothetical protein
MPSEVCQRIEEIAEADAIGDPSLLYDRFTQRDHVSLETYRDARTALALIREDIEDCAPPGSVTREGYLPRTLQPRPRHWFAESMPLLGGIAGRVAGSNGLVR